MGQIIGSAAKPKRCNISKLSQLGTPSAGEHILVSSDNSMNAAGQGNFDCYIVGNGTTAATGLELMYIDGGLKAEVEDLSNTVNGVVGGETIIPYDRSSAISFSIDSSGKWVRANSTVIIPIESGKTYHISGDGTQGTMIGILHSADNIAANQPADFSSFYTQRIPVQKDETYEFIAPNDSTCISMLILSSAGELYPILEIYEEHIDGLVTLFPKTEQLENNDRTQDLVIFGEQPRNNKAELCNIDLSEYDIKNGAVLDTGKWGDGRGKSKLIPTDGLSDIRVLGGDTGQIISFLKDANLVNNTLVNFATGHSNRDIVAAGQTLDFTIPNDCMYICVLVETSGGSARTPEIYELYSYGENSIPEQINSLKQSVNGINTSIYDSDMDKQNIYITNDGEVDSGYSSACIPVRGYHQVLLHSVGAHTLYYSFLKSVIEIGVAPSFANGYIGIRSISTTEQTAIDVPANAEYLYVSINGVDYPSVTLLKSSLDERITNAENDISALSGITVPLNYNEEGDGTSGIAPALNARTGGGKVVIPKGIYAITQQIVIPSRNLNIEGAVWNYPQDPNGVHPSNTGTKLSLLTNTIESVFKTNSDMSGMRMSQLGFQGLTTTWDYDNADGNGVDYYYDPENIKNVGLFIGSGRFDQVSLHRLSFCGCSVGILAKYTIDANVWSEINTDGCDFGIFVDLLELVLHVRRDLALAGGEAKLIPPRVGWIDEAVFLLVVIQVLFAVFLHFFGLQCGFALGRNKQCNILIHSEKHCVLESCRQHFLQYDNHLRSIVVFYLVATLIVIGKGEKALLLDEHRFHVDVVQLVMFLHGLAQRHLHEGASFGGFGHAVQEFFNVFGHR